MDFYTYILQSEQTDGLYIGSTTDLEDRLLRHNNDRNSYTKGKGPWVLLWSAKFYSRKEAVQLELSFKRMKSKARVLRWIDAQSG